MDTASFRFTTDMPTMATRPDDRLPRDSLKRCPTSCGRRVGGGGPGIRGPPRGWARGWRGAPVLNQHTRPSPWDTPDTAPPELSSTGQGRYAHHGMARGTPSPQEEGAPGRHAICANLRAATWRQEALLSTSPRTRRSSAESEAGGEGGEHSWRKRRVHKKGSLPAPPGLLPPHRATIPRAVTVIGTVIRCSL